MPYFTEKYKNEILKMIGYVDRVRTQNEVSNLFRDTTHITKYYKHD